MANVDKQLTCVDCGNEFTFTGAEQDRFAELGFENEPKRCYPCRAAKKAQGGGGRGGSRGGGGGFGGGGGRGGPKEMFPATCSQCNKQTQVPFQPRGDRPVYCSDCYSSRR